MMIDTHCHIDLHDDPIRVISTFEENEIVGVSTTMLPSHYKMSLPHLRSRTCIHPSLGLHPLRVEQGKREVSDFISLASNADYIGEIGLDFSREGMPTKVLQLDILEEILPSIRGGKFVSVHSRGAASALLEALSKAQVGPVCFHYFTGGIELASAVVENGHFFSFNIRMLNGRQGMLLGSIPRDRVLVESDAPFLTKSPTVAIKTAYAIVAHQWGVSVPEAIKQIFSNFVKCRTI